MTATQDEILQMAYALNSLRPSEEWTLDHSADPLYDGLVWLEADTAKPTQQEIDDEIERLKTAPTLPSSEEVVLFDHENRLRSMEGAPPLTLVDFVTKKRG